MAFYSDELIEEVRSRNDIVDVVGGYVRLQKKGNTYFGLCPFHNEKTGSFSVSPHKQMYYCFGCGAGGNVFTFLMQYENFTFGEAMQTLADKVGVELPKQEMSAAQKKEADKRARLLEINKEAAKYFYTLLRNQRGQKAYQYFKNRELSDETMQKFGLGYSDQYSDDLYRYLRSKGYDDAILKETGLITYDEVRGGHDKFWNRAMFPIMDVHNHVIGFGGRVMGDGEPKYLNSPETKIFDKSRNLYGLNFARTSRAGNFILCEGYMDVIALHQAGFNQAVASLGTAFTSGQANLIRRYTDEVLLCYDSDGAGVKAALRALEILKEADLTGKIINLEPYKDPDEFIKNLGQEAFAERIKQAENSFLFEIRMLKREYNPDDPEDKTKFHKEIARKLCGFSIDVERENYIQAVAREYHIGYENLRKLVNQYAAQTGGARPVEKPKSGIQKKQTVEDHKKRTQRMLLTWLTDEPEIYKQIAKYVKPSDFTEELYGRVAEMLFTDLSAGNYNPAAILSRFTEEEEQREVASMFHTKLDGIETKQDKEKALRDIVYAVKKNSYEYYTQRLGSDVTALQQVIDGKRALEELSKVHILLS